MFIERESGDAEPLLGMGSAIRCYQRQTGHKPGRSTWWRWILTNRLESRRLGGRIYTTESAIRRMLAADEQRNRGSANTRGDAAAARLAAIIDRDARGEVA
jgi:hypothetical protein